MISASMLAALSVTPSVKPVTSCAPIIVGIGNATLYVQIYVDVPIIFSGVEVRHSLLVDDKLAYPLLIAIDDFKLYGAIFKCSTHDVVRLAHDWCLVCVEERVPFAP